MTVFLSLLWPSGSYEANLLLNYCNLVRFFGFPHLHSALVLIYISLTLLFSFKPIFYYMYFLYYLLNKLWDINSQFWLK